MDIKDKLSENDTKIEELLAQFSEIITKFRLQQDKYGQWFTGAQLSNLRQIYITHGYKAARAFQAGKIDRKDKEFSKNNALLEIFDAVAKSTLPIQLGGYILGNFNQILRYWPKIKTREVKR